jgi:hypothetical protein
MLAIVVTEINPRGVAACIYYIEEEDLTIKQPAYLGSICANLNIWAKVHAVLLLVSYLAGPSLKYKDQVYMTYLEEKEKEAKATRDSIDALIASLSPEEKKSLLNGNA